MIEKVIINGYVIETGSNKILGSDNFDMASKKEINYYNNPYSNGGVVINEKTREKNLEITGVLIGSDLGDLNTKIDEFKKYIFKNEGKIEIYRKNNLGNTEIYEGNFVINNDDIIYRGQGYINIANFKLNLFIIEGSLKNTNLETNSVDVNYGVDIVRIPLTIKGNTDTDPIIKVKNTGTETITFLELNVGGSNKIIINENLDQGEEFIIDRINKEVRKDTILIDFAGIIPFFSVFDTFIDIKTDDNKSINVYYEYYPKFL